MPMTVPQARTPVKINLKKVKIMLDFSTTVC